ncbi:MAG: methyltransferase [Acidobacteria bacterium]|nr:methyltransferase [Acidobacteriota bacterium]
MSREAWVRALIERHTAPYSRPEFLKAVRALSSRYVEDRARLGTRSPLDSAGKRAAFAGFYAPIHYFTTRAIVRALPTPPSVSRILDLGCGTGVAGLAWASTLSSAAAVTGVDQSAWALDEMRWNGQTLGVMCRTRRASLVDALEREVGTSRRESLAGSALVCAWSINELARQERDRVLAGLLAARERGAAVLVVEPLAVSAVPWWEAWRAPVAAAGGRADEWRFEPDLPQELADLDEAAGFRRDYLTARSFWLNPA